MQLPRLIEYKQWANNLLFNTIARLPVEAIEAPQKIVFGSLINTLNHVYTVDQIFKAHLTGTEHGFTTRRPTQSPPMAKLFELQKGVDRWFAKYADSLSAAEAMEIVDFEFIDGGAGAMSREDMLIHLVNHGTYHRGHVGTMLYEISVEPPTTDYPVFLRQRQ